MMSPNEVSEDLTFEEQIKNFSPESQFLARQLYEACHRITKLEHRDNKMLGISGVFAGIVSGIISYFSR